jgi:hypothetical protein
MRKATDVDYDWDIKIVYTLRRRTKKGISVYGTTELGTKFQTTYRMSWRRFKKSLKNYF